MLFKRKGGQGWASSLVAIFHACMLLPLKSGEGLPCVVPTLPDYMSINAPILAIHVYFNPLEDPLPAAENKLGTIRSRNLDNLEIA